MKQIIYLLSAMAVMSCIAACQQHTQEETFTVEVANETLLKEIIAYHDSILLEENNSEVAKGDSVYVWVYFKQLNDSMTRYSLEYIGQIDILSHFPAEFVCEAGGHPVFFSAAGGCLPYYCPDNSFFSIPQDRKEALMKRYFPQDYKEKLRQEKEKKERGYVSMKTKISHPTICFLTFMLDSLIDRQYGKGMPCDRVYVNMNGQQVLL